MSVGEAILEELGDRGASGVAWAPARERARAGRGAEGSAAPVASPLVAALDDEDPAVAAFAAGLTGRARDAVAVPHLARLLGSPRSRVALMAAHGLEHLRDGLSPAALAAGLQLHPWLQGAALQVLGQARAAAPRRALEPLLGDGRLHDAVIAVWPRCAPREALSLLIGILRSPRDLSTFATALRAVGQLLQRQPAVAAQCGVDEWARLVLAEAEVPDLGARLGRALVGDDGPRTPERGSRLLVAAIARAFATRPLYATLVLAGVDPAVRETLASCPIALGRDQFPALLAGLTSESAGVRGLASRCAAAGKLAAAAPSIEPLLDDPDDEVRATAVHALACLHHDAAVPTIVRALRDPSRLVRDAALLALGRMDPETVSVWLLCETLGTGTLRLPALAICRANPCPEQRRFVESCLVDRRPAVRQAAVAALARLTDGDLATLLRPLLPDPALEVRAEAAAALAQAHDPDAHAVLAAHLDGEVAALRRRRADDDEAALHPSDTDPAGAVGVPRRAAPEPLAPAVGGGGAGRAPRT